MKKHDQPHASDAEHQAIVDALRIVKEREATREHDCMLPIRPLTPDERRAANTINAATSGHFENADQLRHALGVDAVGLAGVDAPSKKAT